MELLGRINREESRLNTMEQPYPKLIRQDLRGFTDALQQLIRGVRSASISWRDENYQALYRSVSGLSKQSQQVLERGEAAAKTAEKFFQIAEEEY